MCIKREKEKEREGGEKGRKNEMLKHGFNYRAIFKPAIIKNEC